MSARFKFVAAMAWALAATSPAGAGSAAPHLSVSSINALNVPDHVYDGDADANRKVDEAFAHALKAHKRVLIDLGGNWCPDCRILAAVMELPEMQTFLHAHYEVVSVDVGRFDKNLQIPARFGITKRLEGVPSVLIATPDGTLVNAGHTAALSDARSMTPQAIADWLASWTD